MIVGDKYKQPQDSDTIRTVLSACMTQKRASNDTLLRCLNMGANSNSNQGDQPHTIMADCGSGAKEAIEKYQKKQ